MPRTHSLDNLRTFLTALVIFHHASIPYGGLGSWPYKPSPHSPSASTTASRPSRLIGLFNVVNQTFFMALFFLLSGYFSARASEKRTRAVFLKEKAKRLGVPCAVYSVLGPGVVELMIAGVRDGAALGSIAQRAVSKVASVRGARGPTWYCAVLLLFDGVLAVWFFPGRAAKTVRDKNGGEENPHIYYLRDRDIFAGLAGAAAAGFLLRLRWPLGSTFAPLGLEMGFLPQYALYYTVGVFAHRSLKTELHRLVPRTSVRIPRALTAMRTMRTVTLLTVYVGVYFVMRACYHEGSSAAAALDRARGGANAIALCYTIFNEALGFLLCVDLLQLFNERQFLRGKWTVRFAGRDVDLARWSYAAFLVHAPVVVGFQCVLDRFGAPRLVKSIVVGVLGCIGSLGVGFALGRRLENMGISGYV